MKKLLLLSLILCLPACGTIMYPHKSKVFERDGISVVQTSTQQRESYLYDKNGSEMACLAPDTDFAITDSQSLNLGIPVPDGGDDSLGESSSETATVLGGRDARVLITRELMYRACELVNNHRMNTEESIEVYKLFLEAAEGLSD